MIKNASLSWLRLRQPEPAEKPVRNLRVLHVGNISNLAYCNAKILRQSGLENVVLCFDFYHFASCPEWQELTGATVSKEMFGDDWFPNFWRLSPELRVRPDWFIQGPQYACLLYMHALREGGEARRRRAKAGLDYQRFKAVVRQTTVPGTQTLSVEEFEAALSDLLLTDEERALLREGRFLDDMTERLWAVMRGLYDEATVRTIGAPLAPGYLDSFFPFSPEFEAYVRAKRNSGELHDYGFELDETLKTPVPAFPREAPVDDAAGYGYYNEYWRTIFDLFDVVILYSTYPIMGYLADVPHYIGYEHGTIRNIPFEDDQTGRLTRLGYETAPCVFITNSDYITASPRLELDETKRRFLPHTYDIEPIQQFAVANVELRPPEGEVIFFAPARQDWVKYDPSMSKGNDRLIRAAALVRDRGLTNFRIDCVAWGQDMAASEALIEELGLTAYFGWTPPLAKRDLWVRYLTSHAIIDQFFISSISGVSYEALALGRPVISWDDGVANATFFEEQPPILSAQTVEQIAARLEEVIRDPADVAEVGPRSASWIRRRHGPARIAEIQLEAFEALRGRERAPPAKGFLQRWFRG